MQQHGRFSKLRGCRSDGKARWAYTGSMAAAQSDRRSEDSQHAVAERALTRGARAASLGLRDDRHGAGGGVLRTCIGGAVDDREAALVASSKATAAFGDFR